MQLFEIRKGWNDLKARLQFNFGHLSDEDLNYKEGKEDELITNLQLKLGSNRKDVIEILNRIQLY